MYIPNSRTTRNVPIFAHNGCIYLTHEQPDIYLFSRPMDVYTQLTNNQKCTCYMVQLMYIPNSGKYRYVPIFAHNGINDACTCSRSSNQIISIISGLINVVSSPLNVKTFRNAFKSRFDRI